MTGQVLSLMHNSPSRARKQVRPLAPIMEEAPQEDSELRKTIRPARSVFPERQQRSSSDAGVREQRCRLSGTMGEITIRWAPSPKSNTFGQPPFMQMSISTPVLESCGFPTPRGTHLMQAPSLSSSPSSTSCEESSFDRRDSVSTDVTDIDDAHNKILISKPPQNRVSTSSVASTTAATLTNTAPSLNRIFIPTLTLFTPLSSISCLLKDNCNSCCHISSDPRAPNASTASTLRASKNEVSPVFSCMTQALKNRCEDEDEVKEAQRISSESSTPPSLDGSIESDQLATLSAPPTPVLTPVVDTPIEEYDDYDEGNGVQLQPEALATLNALMGTDCTARSPIMIETPRTTMTTPTIASSASSIVEGEHPIEIPCSGWPVLVRSHCSGETQMKPQEKNERPGRNRDDVETTAFDFDWSNMDIPSPHDFFAMLTPTTRQHWEVRRDGDGNDNDETLAPTSAAAEGFYRDHLFHENTSPVPAVLPDHVSECFTGKRRAVGSILGIPEGLGDPFMLPPEKKLPHAVEEIRSEEKRAKKQNKEDRKKDLPAAPKPEQSNFGNTRLQTSLLQEKRQAILSAVALASSPLIKHTEGQDQSAIVAHEIIGEYDPEYARKQQAEALRNLSRTERWLTAQKNYMKTISSPEHNSSSIKSPEDNNKNNKTSNGTDAGPAFGNRQNNLVDTDEEPLTPAEQQPALAPAPILRTPQKRNATASSITNAPGSSSTPEGQTPKQGKSVHFSVPAPLLSPPKKRRAILMAAAAAAAMSSPKSAATTTSTKRSTPATSRSPSKRRGSNSSSTGSGGGVGVAKSAFSAYSRKVTTYYRAFRNLATSADFHRRDRLIQAPSRLEAIQTSRIAFPTAHRDALMGQARLVDLPSACPPRRVSTNVVRGDDTLFEDPDRLRRTRDAEAKRLLEPGFWAVEAWAALLGGELLMSPAHKLLLSSERNTNGSGGRNVNKNPPNRRRVLDFGGMPTADWGWFAAHRYPDARIYTVPVPFDRRLATHSASTSKDSANNNDNISGPVNHHVVHTSHLTRLPLADNSFDVVSARELFSQLHMSGPRGTDERDSALRELMRVLKPGGILEFTIMDAELINAAQRGNAASVELAFRLRTLGFDPKPSATFISRLRAAGFEDLKRSWIVLPVGHRPPSAAATLTRKLDNAGTGTAAAAAAAAAAAGLAGSWLWERWLLRAEMEKVAGDLRLGDACGVNRTTQMDVHFSRMAEVVEEGRRAGSGWRCLVGYARKPLHW